VRFIVDVNVGRRVAEFLAQKGHDVVWVASLGQEIADEKIMAKSAREQRIILTVDRHFGNLALRQHEPFFAILRLPSEPYEETRARLANVLSTHSPALCRGNVVIVTKAGVRVQR
jgi:predicted nuclease of predicted toxin-antitoxin system